MENHKTDTFDELVENLCEEQLNGKTQLGGGVSFSWECFAHSDTVGLYVGNYRAADIELSELPHPDDANGDKIEVMIYSNDSPLLDDATEMVLNVPLESYKTNPVSTIAKTFMDSIAYDWLNLGRAIMEQQ